MFPENKKQRGSALILIILLIIAGFLAFTFHLKGFSLDKFNQKAPALLNPGPSITEIRFKPIHKTNIQSFPIPMTKNNQFMIALVPLQNIRNPIYISTKKDTSPYNGALYYGDSESHPSPDLSVTAFIDNKVLNLVSADGRDRVSLPANLEVEYISGWSPDSQKLFIYSSPQNINSGRDFLNPEDKITFDPNRLPGRFYLVDLTKGEVTYQYLLNNFVDWLDSSKIITTSNLNQNHSNFIIYDLSNNIADFKTLGDLFKDYDGSWFSFNKDGTKWVYNVGNTGNTTKTSYSSIVVANFPSLQGKNIDQGGWGEVQSPVLSPSGKNLVYANGAGSESSLTVWDGKNKKRITEASRFRIWVNDDQFIYSNTVEYSPIQQVKYYLYTISTSSKESLN